LQIQHLRREVRECSAELDSARCQLAAARADSRRVASLQRHLADVEEQLVRKTREWEQLLAAVAGPQAVGQADEQRRPRGRPKGSGQRQHAT
jgi:predicted  nucleic acid-binding Zn-ribbon protein